MSPQCAGRDTYLISSASAALIPNEDISLSPYTSLLRQYLVSHAHTVSRRDQHTYTKQWTDEETRTRYTIPVVKATPRTVCPADSAMALEPGIATTLQRKHQIHSATSPYG